MRAWLGLLALAVVTVPVLLLSPAPAHANCGENPEVSVRLDPEKVDLAYGGPARKLTAVFDNTCPVSLYASVRFSVPLADAGVKVTARDQRCHTGPGEGEVTCEPVELPVGESRIAIEVGPPAEPGESGQQTRSGQGRVEVAYDEEPDDLESEDPVSGSFTLTLQHREQVAEVSGTVVDAQTSEPVPNATVRVVDGDDREHTTATGPDGKFRLRSTSEKIVMPGTLRVTVAKRGYELAETYQKARDGQRVTGIRLQMRPSAKPGSSASPAPAATAAGPGTPWWGWLLVVLGALLLVACVVFIVTLRRRGQPIPATSPATSPAVGPAMDPATGPAMGPAGGAPVPPQGGSAGEAYPYPGGAGLAGRSDHPTLIDVPGVRSADPDTVPGPALDAVTRQVPVSPEPPAHRRGRHARPDN